MSSEDKAVSTVSPAPGSGETAATSVEVPAPSYWPMVLAFGIMLVLAGLVTHFAVSFVGLAIAFYSAVGWWRDVIPVERFERIPMDPVRRPAPIEVEARSVMRLRAGEDQHRQSLPVRMHPYSAGVLGGMVGGFVMALLACIYGLVAQHSIWYPVNILAGVVLPGIGSETTQQLRTFQALPFVLALTGHAIISILVGIIYAAILPMFPKWAPLWAGILMPVFWSGVVATCLDIVNPALDQRISWPWFIACQLGYGLFGGFVVAHTSKISTMRSWDFVSRAFIEAPGLRPPRGGDERSRQ